MNRLLVLATILLVALCLTDAIPIPDSFHQHRLGKRCNEHAGGIPKPSILPSGPSHNLNIQPVPNSPSRNIQISENSDENKAVKHLYLPETSIVLTSIALPSATEHGVKKLQAVSTTAPSDTKTIATTAAATKTTVTTTTTAAAATTTTTTSEKHTVTTTSKATETATSGSGSGSFPYSGDGTWYNPGLGSCGITNTESDYIAAMNYQQMENGANPNNNPNCGRKVQIKGPDGVVTVTITDTCPTCAHGSIDLSPIAFEKIASLGDGRVPIHWDWLD